SVAGQYEGLVEIALAAVGREPGLRIATGSRHLEEPIVIAARERDDPPVVPEEAGSSGEIAAEVADRLALSSLERDLHEPGAPRVPEKLSVRRPEGITCFSVGLDRPRLEFAQGLDHKGSRQDVGHRVAAGRDGRLLRQSRGAWWKRELEFPERNCR